MDRFGLKNKAAQKEFRGKHLAKELKSYRWTFRGVAEGLAPYPL